MWTRESYRVQTVQRTTAHTHFRTAASYHAGALRWERMCTTTRAAGARRAAAGGLHPAPLHGAADDPCAAKVAAHSEAYERALVDGAAEEADWSEPVRRLPLRELVVDPAVVIFMLMHVLAAATPWWYGGLRRQDIVITVASYVARMFGARPPRRPWLAKARPVALRLRRLTQAMPAAPQASPLGSTGSCLTDRIRRRV